MIVAATGADEGVKGEYEQGKEERIKTEFWRESI
jgi:hypothetical protein